jgi:hypothetical protein
MRLYSTGVFICGVAVSVPTSLPLLPPQRLGLKTGAFGINVGNWLQKNFRGRFAFLPPIAVNYPN